MKVSEYHGYGRSKRGLHWTPVPYHAHTDLTWALDKCRSMRLGWMTLLDDGGGSTLQPSSFYGGRSIIDMLLERDIIPVVRFYAPANARLDARMEDAAGRLAAKGVRYIFWQNEPEVGSTEWEKRPRNWVEIVTRNYVEGAYKLLKLGVYPGAWATTTFHFPDANGNIVNPYQVYMTPQERDDIFRDGAGWIAIHPYAKNHPLDYPYDEVNQTGKPLTADEYQAKLQEVKEEYRRTQHLWVWDDYQTSEHHINLIRERGKNPGATIYTDDTCFWMYKGINKCLADVGLLEYVPLLATEAGPVVGERDDGRYARVTPQEQIRMIDAELADIQGVDNFFALCFWLAGVQKLNSVTKDSFEDQAWWTDRHNEPFGLRGEMPIVSHFIEKEEVVVNVNKSKLGPHAQYLNNEVVQAIGYVKPRVVKVMDPSREQLQAIRAASPGSIIVARVYQANQDYQSNPAGAGVAFANRYAGIVDLIDVAEVFNESVNNSCSKEQCLAFDKYQAAFANRLYELNPKVRAGLFCLPTGNFGYPGEPALNASWFPQSFSLPPSQVYICLHEYTWYSWDYEAPARMTRYRQQMAGLSGYQVLITECGFTQAIIAGKPDVGWRSDSSVWTKEKYIAALRSYDAELQRDDYVVGATIFNCGPSSGWDTFESLEEWRQAVGTTTVETTNDAAAYGVTISPAQVEPGEMYWKITKIHHLAQQENNGNHNLYVNVFRSDGPAWDKMVQIFWPDNNPNMVAPIKMEKPYPAEPMGNTPLWKGQVVGARVLDELDSDTVMGIHTSHPDEPPGNTLYHHSFLVEWQLTTAPGEVVTPEPTPIQPTDAEIREEAWNHAYLGPIRFYSEAALSIKARELGLGAPVTNEFDLRGTRSQGFSLGIMSAVIGDWQNIKKIDW